MNTSFFSPAPNVMVVREVYDSNGAHEQFALELERCLEAGPNTIVIEPAALGDETARWIAVGNCLHKTAVLAGFGSLFGGEFSSQCICIHLLLKCQLCCTQYFKFISTPVVLVRREDGRRKVLHSSISVLAGALCLYRLYQMYK
ncbi:hypothetical protein HAZT_HAZT007681 [Hyalella azteca]|uniref:Uncharacterized protein n=1 Tax=Hyalella azteca TaxID=294128 RepID=A0A6A0H3Z3_HYAAZ|nr:hypothetical protein HAZT_HAZT007681 [Hyalella azteca]